MPENCLPLDKKVQSGRKFIKSPRKPTRCKVRTHEKIEELKKAVEKSPLRSARKHVLALDLSYVTVHRVLYNDLGFRPYKMQTE